MLDRQGAEVNERNPFSHRTSADTQAGRDVRHLSMSVNN